MIDFVQKYVSQIKIGDKTINNATAVTINGASTGRYSASDSKLTVWGVCTESEAHATVEMDGMLISDKTIDLQEMSDGGSKLVELGLVNSRVNVPSKWVFSYRCQGNTLEIDPPDDLERSLGDRPPWKFTKQ